MTLLTPKTMARLVRNFLAQQEPGFIRAQRGIWRDQGKALTPAAVREMLQGGNIPAGTLDIWQAQYADFILSRVVPRLDKTAQRGAGLVKRISTLPLDAIRQAVEDRGTQLIADLGGTQRRAVQAILRHHIGEVPFAQDELAAVLRPALGLTESQAGRLTALRQELVNEGVPRDEITRILTRETNRALGNRASVIARTELAAAHNSGTDIAIREGVSEGAFDGATVTKEWNTQADERTCPICSPLDGKPTDLDGLFSSLNFAGPLPPAHPHCRCVVLYRTS